MVMLYNICMTSSMNLLEKADLHKKNIILRIDSDVDIKDGKVLDDTRLVSALPTIKHILANYPQRVVVIGHLGRPEHQYEVGENLKENETSLEVIAKWFANELEGKIEAVDISGFEGWKIMDNLFLLENIRLYKGEEENDPVFVASLAKLGDIFINEAFAVSHRRHASTYGVAKLLTSYAGIHFAKEIDELSKIINNPKRPLVVIIGGAKIETKLPLVEKMHHVADFVLVGGEIASHVKELIKVQHEKISGKKSVVLVADLQDNGLDITEKSAQNFVQIIQNGATIVWNGPLGQTGKNPETEKGTLVVAKAIISSKAYSVVGGGDTLSFLKQKNLLGGFGFVSTGGGAMLEFLSGKELPAIKPLLT